jgi:hypothetical protein
MAIDLKDRNVQIILLSAIVLIGTWWILTFNAEEDYQDIVLFSNMTPAQVQAAVAKPVCKQALNNYCPLAAKSQAVMNGVSLVPELSAVKNTCGNMFPVNQACNQPLPNWTMLRGGIQAKPTASM